MAEDSCTVCGCRTNKFCSGCKIVLYCSPACQRSHWNSGHKKECKDFKINGKYIGATKSVSSSKCLQKVLFRYEEFEELFSWNKPSLPPCGLLNSGNNCYANAVLQCLAYTKPLIAFLSERDHKRECRKNDWCFLCEFQTHIERAQSLNPFSPINILSRLPRIGGNLVYGEQEDAHEFMRFAIDTMQSVCLDEFGGEKVVPPSAQETTLIHHIFGGHLQSQVVCTKCNNVSKRCENIMDLTVEIQGNAASLEDCLDQFTARECLDGDNKYKCDGCNDYVLAWKRLTILQAPNILTIALKRFQSGMFGKLNKRVTFPETLDLSPYMSETAEDDCVYKLYGVIVHLDKMNASYFGHYICYIKDFCGNWYRVDDVRVTRVDSDEVLFQGAYMLLYSRISARKSCLHHAETQTEEKKENMDLLKEIQTEEKKENMDLLLKQTMADLEELEDGEEDVEMVDEVPLSVAVQETAAPLEQADDNFVDARESVGENYDENLSAFSFIRPGFLNKVSQKAADPIEHTHDHVTVAINPATAKKITGNSVDAKESTRNKLDAKVKPLIRPGFFKKQSQNAADAKKQPCCANSDDMNEKADKILSAEPLIHRGFLTKHYP